MPETKPPAMNPRDTAIEQLEYALTKKNAPAIKMWVTNALAALRSEVHEEKWISMKDRLPEKNEVVIGVGVKWTRGDLVVHGDCANYDPDAIIEEDRPTETLWRWHSDGTPILRDNVTHWMPLPQPPKP